MSTQNVEELVNIYLTIRNAREKIKSDYEEADKAMKDDLSVIEQELLAVCNDTNTNGFKTSGGTVTRKLNERFYCNDWDNFRTFILDHQAVELLERRIHQGNFKEFLAAHQAEGLPPGVNVMREFGIVVRKASEQ